jgi:hypothetical protein
MMHQLDHTEPELLTALFDKPQNFPFVNAARKDNLSLSDVGFAVGDYEY